MPQINERALASWMTSETDASDNLNAAPSISLSIGESANSVSRTALSSSHKRASSVGGPPWSERPVLQAPFAVKPP
jgi:hypothetical protein